MKSHKLFKKNIPICRYFGYQVIVEKQNNSYCVEVLEQYDDDPKAPFGDGVGVGVGLSEHYIRKEMDKQEDYLLGFFQGLSSGNAIMRTHYYSLGLKPYLTKIRTLETANNVASILSEVLCKAVEQASRAYHDKNNMA